MTNADRTTQVRRGMQLAATRPEVMPDEAGSRIQPVYEDIQRTLRVPIVNLIFRTLANDPDYLVGAWTRFAPAARTRAFEAAADRLRASALLTPPPTGEAARWEEPDDMERVRAFNDTIHYVLPKLLLIATAWDEGRFGGGAGDASEISPGIAEGTARVPMVSGDDASDRVKALFTHEKERHGHPLVSSYYRGLANWPDLLEGVWSRIEPVVESPEYRDARSRLIGEAREEVRQLPIAGEIPGAARTDDISALLAAFRENFIPTMLLDAVLIKAVLDGPGAAIRSRFSAG